MRFPLRLRSLFALTVLSSLSTSACGPSGRVRPNVPAVPVTVVNPNPRGYMAHVAAGLEPGAPVEVPANQCVVVRPPPHHEGEIRIQVLDPELNVYVVDLYSRRAQETWQPCDCSAGHFSRCINIPLRAGAMPGPNAGPPPRPAGGHH